MNDFLKKWQEDRRFRTKVKLIASTTFVILVAIYTFSLDTGTYSSPIKEDLSTNIKQDSKKILKLSNEYEYTITINIDDQEYKYIGKKEKERELIQKIIGDKQTNYIYQNENYYIEDNTQNENYIITTRDEVYDIINYNYVNFSTINEYLNKATKDGNQYIVYLKDIILGNSGDDYFVIDLNDDNIFIDYTVLMKEFNKNINKYTIRIEIKNTSNNEINKNE